MHILKTLPVAIMALVLATVASAAATANPIILGNKRITLITPTLFRLEYAEHQRFLDKPTLFASCRDSMMTEGFTVEDIDDGATCRINTGKVTIEVKKDNMPFGYSNIKVWYTRYGEQRRTGGIGNSVGNLGGSVVTLDAVSSEIPLLDGILSDRGWYYIVDTGKETIGDDGWFEVRDRSHIQDEYCFVYGDDFHAAFRDLGAISGHVPMTRKYMHGIWYSRWYPFDDKYIADLIQGYKDNGFPLDVLSIDMDWHTQDHKEGIGHAWNYGWTGHTWNRRLLTNPDSLVATLHADGIAVCLNEHPHDGIRPADDCYPDFMKAMGYADAPADTCLLYDLGDKKYMENYFLFSRRENRRIGIDFWWVDWQQDYVYPYVRGSHNMPNLPWLNRLYYNDTRRDGMRGAGYSRWGGWGDHKYPMSFSGDAASNWDMLAFEVKLTQTSGNQGCYYWAHDIGGFFGATNPELLARWSQFGALSAALRVHASLGPDTDRRPWLWGDLSTEAMRRAYRFRSELMPYIYTSIRQTHDTMLPFNRAMYVDYPTDSAAYNRYAQFLIGDNLLAAPITSPGIGDKLEASQNVWFPSDAQWYDFFTDEAYAPGSEATVTKDIYSFPVFVRGGTLLPMQPFTERPGTSQPETIVLRLYPATENIASEFSLYEDDGISTEYETGRYARTKLMYTQSDNKGTVVISGAVGNYTNQPENRSYELELGAFGSVTEVRVDGRKVKPEIRDGRTIVKIPYRPVSASSHVTFSFAGK